MKFKRNWFIIYRDIFGTLLLLYTVILFLIIIPYIKEDSYFIVLVDHFVFFCFVCLFLVCYYFSGALTDIVILDDMGITFQQRKKPQQQIRWEEVTRIIRTKHTGGKVIVLCGVYYGSYGDEIWFYTNKKIENYILSIHPELQSLFPDKKDYKKWQNRNVQLRR